MKAVRLKRREQSKNLQLFTLLIPTIVLLVMFCYLPMFGVVLAFKKYRAVDGIFGSKWNGFKNFEFFFTSQDAGRVLRNTLVLNFAFIVLGIICAVIFALVMYEVKKPRHVKVYQTVAILPNFLSWVAVGYIVYTLLEPSRGIANRILSVFGVEGVNWYAEAAYWPVILTLVYLWKNVGLNSIIYYAALMGVDQELYEAAELDGATKFQKVWSISIPSIMPVVLVKFVMDMGTIFRADFGLFYNVTKNIGRLFETTDVIDTYIYRALLEQGNIGMSSAVGLFQSVVCMVTLLIVNWIIRKVSPENSLF